MLPQCLGLGKKIACFKPDAIFTYLKEEDLYQVSKPRKRLVNKQPFKQSTRGLSPVIQHLLYLTKHSALI